MANDKIIVRGAKEHNLKNISVEIPRNQLVVITGLSGSGKSSLAFDTIYAEGQRRYVESLSSYARMFLGQMDKPNVESIEGLSPAISIDQKTTSKNPRSTVGTVTEIYDYLRLLYARIGVPHCTVCGREIRQQTVDQIVDKILAYPEGSKIQLLAPVVRGRKGEHQKVLDSARKSGFARVRADGIIYDLSENIPLEKNKKHNIEIVVDRLVIKDSIASRLSDSIETASKLGNGLVMVSFADGEDVTFSQKYACPEHGVSIEDLSPRMFSFNNPFGACPKCTGLGVFLKIDEDKIIPDRDKSIAQNGIKGSGWAMEGSQIAAMYMEALARRYKFSLNEPIKNIPDDVIDKILYGTGAQKLKIKFETGTYQTTFEGVIPSLERRYQETQSEGMKAAYEEYMAHETCPVCKGRRLKPEALAVTVGQKNIAEISEWNIRKTKAFLDGLTFGEKDGMIAAPILREVDARLGFLCDVGLDYLTLSRAAATLSGGEAQRIRLATQIGSGLVGVLYILDEPSIGLHQRDNARLLKTLRHLQELGNTLIVVEHDEETLRSADYLVDIGPGAGEHGGRVVAQGTVEDVMACPESITGQYLSGKKSIPVPAERRLPSGWLTVRGAKEHNLKNIDVDFPLGVFCCVTGVSGSGKSSLVNAILYGALAHLLNRARPRKAAYDGIEGVEQLDKIISIDQSPIGRTPRSNPATYTGLFDMIRRVFAQLPEAKIRGYKENRFSFNVKGGRCEACSGDGLLKIEMHFMADIYVPCEVCHGKRYNRETLEVKYKGLSIADVLDLTVEEAMGVFEAHQPIMQKLRTLYDVGLGYMKLGQPSTTLSGGEAQRVKLATELSRRATGKTLVLLDEPTTGLHMDDVNRLIKVLQRLTDAGNTVLVIEHNLDVIKTADYIIDLGPEGGDGGGTIVAQGTPEDVAKVRKSYTGQFLKGIL